jgi:hypothetical protein
MFKVSAAGNVRRKNRSASRLTLKVNLSKSAELCNEKAEMKRPILAYKSEVRFEMILDGERWLINPCWRSPHRRYHAAHR